VSDSNKKRLVKRRKKRLAFKHKIEGDLRPRLLVFRSNRHIYAQVIDNKGNVLASSGDNSKSIVSELKDAKTKTDISKVIGKLVAEKAVEAGIKAVIFDRNGFGYHGRIKALADSAREAGLEF
jgi:large subunit ribosomal protein L18